MYNINGKKVIIFGTGIIIYLESLIQRAFGIMMKLRLGQSNYH